MSSKSLGTCSFSSSYSLDGSAWPLSSTGRVADAFYLARPDNTWKHLPAALAAFHLTMRVSNEPDVGLMARLLLFRWFSLAAFAFDWRHVLMREALTTKDGGRESQGKKTLSALLATETKRALFFSFHRNHFSLTWNVNIHMTLTSSWKIVRTKNISVPEFPSVIFSNTSEETVLPPLATFFQLMRLCRSWYELSKHLPDF